MRFQRSVITYIHIYIYAYIYIHTYRQEVANMDNTTKAIFSLICFSLLLIVLYTHLYIDIYIYQTKPFVCTITSFALRRNGVSAQHKNIREMSSAWKGVSRTICPCSTSWIYTSAMHLCVYFLNLV